MPSKGYASSGRISSAPGAFYEVLSTDFGQIGGAAPSLAYNAGAGSLAATTARCAITWITAQGESLPSTEATVTISASTGAFTITQPTVPTNGAPVIGWRVYSSSGAAGSALLNVAALSTTQVQQNFVTTQGTLAGFAVGTTAVQVLIYGAGQAEPGIDLSGIQTALPKIAANTTVDYYVVVPDASRLWRTQKCASFMRPSGVAENAGITIGNTDIVAPTYPGTSTSVAAGAYISLANTLYVAQVGGTTASTFIGASAFNQTKSATTTDGSVTWLSLGKCALIRMHISNSSGSAAQVVSQEFDFFAE